MDRTSAIRAAMIRCLGGTIAMTGIATTMATAQSVSPRAAQAPCPQKASLTPRSPSETAAAVAQVTQALRMEVANLSPNASSEDAEAAITFALSNINQPSDIRDAALAQIATENVSANIRQAIANARQALRECQPMGTAGLARGSTGAQGGFASSSPIIGVGGGGSSNYSAD